MGLVPFQKPIGLELVLKDPLASDKLAHDGRGTKSHVWFFRRAACSSSIAAHKFESARALWKVFRTGDRGSTGKSVGCRKPSFARVTILCWLTTGASGTAPLGKGGAPVLGGGGGAAPPRRVCCRSKPTGEQRQATRRAGRSPGRWQALLPRRRPTIPATRRGLWRRRACHLTYTRSGRCGRACEDWPAHTNTRKRKSEPWSAPRDDSCIGFKEPIESRCQIGSVSIRILMNKANNYKAASIKSSWSNPQR